MRKLDDAFCYASANTATVLERLLRRYERDGTAITVNFRQLVGCLSNPDRATHLIHAYPAKLLMHIPFFFLANPLLSRRGSHVLDPFCGSGTVLLESLLSGRCAFGFDNNPLACLISRVKTTPLPMKRVEVAAKSLLARIPDKPKGSLPDVVNLDHWFYPHVARQLQCIRQSVNQTRDDAIRDFFLVSFSQCVRKVSLADPRLAVPVRLQKGQYPNGHPFSEASDARLRWLRRVNVQKVFASILQANLERIASLHSCPVVLPPVAVHRSDARNLCTASTNADNAPSTLPNASIDLIITSPPYPGAQKYIRSASLSLGWLELCPSSSLIELKRATIGREEYNYSDYSTRVVTGVRTADRLLRKIWDDSPIRATIAGTYLNEMRDALRQSHRVLRAGAHLVLVAANNRVSGHAFRTQEYLRQIAEEIGFTTVLRLTDTIRSRGLMTKRNHTASVIDREWVLVFAK